LISDKPAALNGFGVSQNFGMAIAEKRKAVRLSEMRCISERQKALISM